MTRGKLPQGQRPEAYACQLFYRIADALAHASHFTLTSFAERDFQPGLSLLSALDTDLGRGGFAFFQADAPSQLFQRLGRRHPFHLDAIRLADPVAWVG